MKGCCKFPNYLKDELIDTSDNESVVQNTRDALKSLFKNYFVPSFLPIKFDESKESNYSEATVAKIKERIRWMHMSFGLAECFSEFDSQIEELLLAQCSQSRLVTSMINASTQVCLLCLVFCFFLCALFFCLLCCTTLFLFLFLSRIQHIVARI